MISVAEQAATRMATIGVAVRNGPLFTLASYPLANRKINVRYWGGSRRAAFCPETCRSAFRSVSPIDGTGTATGGWIVLKKSVSRFWRQ